MKVLDPGLDIDGFFRRVRNARERVLLLDYDGTLAPFRVDASRALPYASACAALRRVSAAGTRVVIVSGRRLDDLRAPLEMLPQAEVWASHGWEHAVNGRVLRRKPSDEALRHLAAAEALAAPLRDAGLRLEIKIASVAAHWRGLTQAVATRLEAAVHERWSGVAGGALAMLPFDGGIEIRARGHDKGDAVRHVLAACGPRPAVAYLGDDFTDEDAFAAMRGKGLAVLVRRRQRPTCANVWLGRTSELVSFLERWRPEAPAA